MTLRKRLRMMSFTDKIVRIGCLGLIIGLVGKASVAIAQLQGAETEAYISSKPAALQPAFHQLVEGGARDSVLNNMQIATLAIKLGDDREAADAIDRALLDINKYYGLTEEAAKARSLWHEEGAKTFKGEPYERAMANYYRGMLDLKLGDYDNARASFDNGFLQDAFAEEEQHQADFALLAFLAGWSAQLAGNDSLAEERFNEVAKLRPDFIIPPREHDRLVVIETGKSPRKLADGVGHAELVYRRGKKFPEKGARVLLAQPVKAYPMEDIFMQASTRGGRGVDRILDGKISFVKKNIRSGSLLTEAATGIQDMALLNDSSTLGDIGAGISVLGSMQLLMAQNAKPRADTRYWDGLPEAVHVLSYASSEFPDSEIGIQYFDKYGEDIPELLVMEPVSINTDGTGLVWSISQKSGYTP